MAEELKNFPIVLEMPVRWGDMDARGHVNNTIYYRYFESSRIALFELLNVYTDPTTALIAPILSYQDCHYKAPLTYPDIIYVGAKIKGVEESKIIIQHSLKSKRLNRIAAEGEAHIVWYNYQEKKKAVIPDDLRQEIVKLKYFTE
ncbi:MAG: acyl-CoA thioesterase [Candidatus Lokiarchaeota archaeon]|nr:acyl-CoA thioesterase [Candidatus Lokiarchaeota archaeon]